MITIFLYKSGKPKMATIAPIGLIGSEDSVTVSVKPSLTTSLLTVDASPERASFTVVVKSAISSLLESSRSV
ncbi:hypothetical protein A9264_15945 [Vibrio sp. UCD-FRSSP16_10]|uniref:hypothetical protein n=1 Tax=unclassified Vibrio TaxID=2614977 RepID=UPI0007FC96B1|nr:MULTISPECIES: hypothetical protein [unclassified Vibrio]OBT12033.1 hypothetical protein A9260_15925 [Vibrio sp. UCD-FRSSP16_30]OBT18186.1 hypothetical protein A9264_15945 [Vibrio sp. UCD-FRSSP16_10]